MAKTPRARPVPIDLDDLEIALTSLEEAPRYLDLRTGVSRTAATFPSSVEAWELSPDEVDEGLLKRYLVRVLPLPAAVPYGWMVAFAASVDQPRLRESLEVALRGRGAFQRFKRALADHPDERERWLVFRAEQARAAVRSWLEEHEIDAIDEAASSGE